MKFLAGLFLSSGLMAQTFQIVPSTAPHGGAGSLLITLISPAGKKPVALQWIITLGAEVTAPVEDIVAGEAATAAEKAITCAAAKPAVPGGLSYICVLAGGVKSIDDGTVFRVKYKVKPNAAPQKLTVRVSEAIAVLQHGNQLQQIDIRPVEGTITVR